MVNVVVLFGNVSHATKKILPGDIKDLLNWNE